MSGSEPGFLRAVHYFGTAQPGNFWDAARLEDAPVHLRKIRADGFNAVILVVPWRGFQPGLFPPRMDPWCMARLRTMLEHVDDAELACILRVTFPWNHDPDSELDFDQRALGLFTREDVRAAWLAYLSELRDLCSCSAGFRFAFFSWEDLPSIRELMIHRSFDERLQLADATGFRSYLLARFDPGDLAQMYGTRLERADQIYIPRPDCRAYEHYNAFVNECLGQLLEQGRAVWPQLSMQIRADYELLDIDGAVEWLRNDVREHDPKTRVSYYFPYMYAQNGGETLSAAQALANFEQVMLRVSDQRRNPAHFLDQLVYWDESPQFSHWARIDPEEMDQFLAGAVGLLQTLSMGYGLWNYFDYRVNHLYNPNFQRGLHGWEATGEVSLVQGTDSPAVRLGPAASISQVMVPDWRGNATWLYDWMRFGACVDGPGARLRLAMDRQVEAEIALSGQQSICVLLPPERHRGCTQTRFRIENVGSKPMLVSALQLWGFVYRSRIYDEHGCPDRFLHAVRAMNQLPLRAM